MAKRETPAAKPKAAQKGGLSRFLPGTDRNGRFSPVRTLAFLGGLAPLLWLNWLGFQDRFGPKPSTFIIHYLGDHAIYMLIATLAVTPLRALTRWNALIGARRTLGLWALAYASLHLLTYAGTEGFAKAWSEIWLRFYLTIGFVALVVFAVLGITSNDASIRRLGAGWRRLHQLVYPATALGLWHYFLQTKNDITAPLLQTGLFALLMGWRLLAWRRKTGFVWMLVLAIAAGLATALFEAGWYYFRSGLSPLMILEGNLDVDYEIRPPLIVAGVGLVAAVLAIFMPRAPEKPARAARPAKAAIASSDQSG